MIKKLESFVYKINSIDDVDISIYFLELLNKINAPLEETAVKVFDINADEKLLGQIVSLLPGKADVFEQILERKNPESLLDYYESAGKLKEGLLLIQRTEDIRDDRVYNFFKKQKSIFKEEAEKIFLKRVDYYL